MTNIYDRGDIVRLTATFTDLSGSPSDPSAIVLRIKQPDTSIVVHNFPGDISKSATGVYFYDLPINESGDYFYRYESTGTVQAAGESLFHVYKSNVI